MNLSVLFAALAALPLDHKKACSISLDNFIKKDEVELRIAEQGNNISDQLLATIASDGGTPIAPKARGGSVPRPNSKTSRIRNCMIPYLESMGGNARAPDVRNYIKDKLTDITNGDIYNAGAEMVKQNTLRRAGGVWSLISGVQQKVA